ncbi:hypothetical protein GGR50DRAFT_308352 [Xylaria sp. CBS 124048]|nr:hypothetical protein GGR50DRAFT_308352 [Xylaria sp. CBS 124048]
MAPSSASLHMMTKLSPYVFTYEPSETRPAPTVEISDPKLIILAAWMDAKDAHIAKYIAHYQSIYPDAIILLIKFVLVEAMLAPVASSAVQHAVWYFHSLIRADILSANPERPEVLAHIFSNGGTTSMRNVYVAYKRLFGRPFPLHSAIFDSCPGHHGFSNSYNAIMAGFPPGILHVLIAPFIMLMIFVSWLWHTLFSFIAGEDFLTKNARIINDRRQVRQTNRTYIYSKADNMVGWRDIEQHAKSAVSKGFDVRQEMFENSPHVFHMRTDSKRYWLIVQETWKKAVSVTP